MDIVEDVDAWNVFGLQVFSEPNHGWRVQHHHNDTVSLPVLRRSASFAECDMPIVPAGYSCICRIHQVEPG